MKHNCKEVRNGRRSLGQGCFLSPFPGWIPGMHRRGRVEKSTECEGNEVEVANRY